MNISELKLKLHDYQAQRAICRATGLKRPRFEDYFSAGDIEYLLKQVEELTKELGRTKDKIYD